MMFIAIFELLLLMLRLLSMQPDQPQPIDQMKVLQQAAVKAKAASAPVEETVKPKKVAAKKVTAKKPVGEEYEITAYSVGDDYTPSHGITASGERVREGRTIACPRPIELGTEIYIPNLQHTYVCTDRGGAIKGKRLDIYFDDVNDALQFGRQTMKVVVREES